MRNVTAMVTSVAPMHGITTRHFSSASSLPCHVRVLPDWTLVSAEGLTVTDQLIPATGEHLAQILREIIPDLG